jgi:hypothetical protein
MKTTGHFYQLKSFLFLAFLYSNCILNIPTKCTYTIKYMYYTYYQHSPSSVIKQGNNSFERTVKFSLRMTQKARKHVGEC